MPSLSPNTPLRPVLVTGAAGRVGRVLVSALQSTYALSLLDRRPLPYAWRGRWAHADAADFTALLAACQGMHTVIHLAAGGSPAMDWDHLPLANLSGSWAICEAARQAGCARLVLASSVQVELHPATPYASAKRWAESLGRAYSQRSALSVICLRLGSFAHPRAWHIWPQAGHLGEILTHRDGVQLFRCAVEAAPELRYGVYTGVSANHPARFDLSAACRELGYAPQDDAYALAAQAARDPRRRAQRLYQWLRFSLPWKLKHRWEKLTAR
jgi:hypothetical protein